MMTTTTTSPSVDLGVGMETLSASVWATDGQRHIGNACASGVRPDGWMVNRVFVEPEHRGQGLGTRMLKKLLEVLRSMQVEYVIVTPGGYGSDKRRLRKFYEGAGFKPFELDREIVYCYPLKEGKDDAEGSES